MDIVYGLSLEEVNQLKQAIALSQQCINKPDVSQDMRSCALQLLKNATEIFNRRES